MWVCFWILLIWAGDSESSTLDMLLAVCANIEGSLPSMDGLRGTFRTRTQCISACCLLSGEPEDKARKFHKSHEYWLQERIGELAEVVRLFTDILPRKAPEKMRDLTATVAHAWRERVMSKMWSVGLRQTALTLMVSRIWIKLGWDKLLGSMDTKLQGVRLCALLEHLEEEDRGPGGETHLQVFAFVCFSGMCV